MIYLLLLFALLFPATLGAQGWPQVVYDAGQRIWLLSNEQIEASYALNEKGQFRLSSLGRKNGKPWVTGGAPVSSPVWFDIDGTILDQDTAWELIETHVESAQRDGLRHIITLWNAAAKAEVVVGIEMHSGQPFIRTACAYRNLDAAPHYVGGAAFLNMALDPQQQEVRAFYVNQFRQIFTEFDRIPSQLFEPRETSVSPGQPVSLFTGAYADQCTWLAIADPTGRGIVFGWEADARSTVAVSVDDQSQAVRIQGGPWPLHAPVAPGEGFSAPAAFLGLYQGDWDEASYRTHRYVEAVLATPLPDDNFPYMMFDTWGYGQGIWESGLEQMAHLTAQLGVETFIVDLGWARHIGEWEDDPGKFPKGLRSFSDLVHRLGMKLGLHFVPVEAASESAVIKQNPDWASSVNNEYFYAVSICLSNVPTQTWLRQAAMNVVLRYDVDWLVQDGENLVKECSKSTHTHDPANSNWDNSVNGIDAFMDFMRGSFPRVGWENNADGGTMSTFSAVNRYTTFGSCDACEDLDRRRSVWGMTYVFPPRFISRYMPEPPTKFTTRSSMFGGPWILMQPITQWSPEQIELVRQEIALYKSLRGIIREGKVFHLLGPPDGYTISAIESFHPDRDAGVIFVYRPDSPKTSQVVYPRGLNPQGAYRVSFQESRDAVVLSGAALMRDGVDVKLPTKDFAEIVYISPLN